MTVRTLVDIATRRAAGSEVALMWNRVENTLYVRAYDAKTREEIAIPVSADDAAEVYRHPFAYAHRSRVVAGGAGEGSGIPVTAARRDGDIG